MPDGSRVLLGDFSRLRPPYDHVAMVPQWDLLDLLVTAAREEPSFAISTGLAATGTIEENGVVTGVHLRPYRDVRTPGNDDDGDAEELRADVVIACDGRDSVLRTPRDSTRARSRCRSTRGGSGSPANPVTGDRARARVRGTDVLLSFPRPDYHQVAYFAPKGSDPALRAEGVAAFRQRVARLRPDFAGRVDAIASMDDVHVLDVRMDRLTRWWRPGLLCIGDAAHAMSPAGGVGINLAVQDAVATAAILVPALRSGHRGAGLDAALAAVQRRRSVPARMVQTAQGVLHRVVFERASPGGCRRGRRSCPSCSHGRYRRCAASTPAASRSVRCPSTHRLGSALTSSPSETGRGAGVPAHAGRMKQRVIGDVSVSAIGLAGCPCPSRVARTNGRRSPRSTPRSRPRHPHRHRDAYHLAAHDEVGHNEELIARAVRAFHGPADDVLIATRADTSVPRPARGRRTATRST